MSQIINRCITTYKLLFDDLADHRTKHWPLVAKPYQPILIVGIYLWFVLKWGPKFMNKRKPFKLDNVMIIYNAFQVLVCGYLVLSAIYEAWGWKYKWICEPVDSSESEHALHIANLVYYYYFLKLLDLMDTVFFILRKKMNQVTFLHVYHHSGMVLLVWACATYYPGGHGTSVGLVNSFVHVIMYSYYLLTIAMPQIKNSLWWKKYVTQLQIFQFLICVVHMGSIAFVPGCAYPRWIAFFYVPQNLFMLILFVDFYIKTYIKKPKINENKEKVENDTQNIKFDYTEDNGKIQLLIRKNRDNNITEKIK